MKRFIGRVDIKDALKKLGKLTDEQARMAITQNLKTTHNVDERVRGAVDTVVTVDDRVTGVDDRVAGVDGRVACVDGKVASVDGTLNMVGEKAVEVINCA